MSAVIAMNAGKNPGDDTQKPPKPRKLRTARPSAIMANLVARADADGDGKLTQEELNNFLSKTDVNQVLVGHYKKIMFLQAIAALVIIVVLAVVTGVSVEAAKESHVSNSLLVDNNGKAVQCASKELKLGENGLLTDKLSQAGVRTLKAPAVSHPLNSRVPDKYLKQLVEFTANVDGQDQYVKVNSFRRVVDVTMECGSYVLLSTNLGDFKLDTKFLWHNGGKVEVTGAFTKGRKLSIASLTAFYEDVENIEFECKQIWKDNEKTIKKPSMPTFPMSMIEVSYEPCKRRSREEQNICTSSRGANARQSKPGVTEDGRHVVVVNHVLLTEEVNIKVSHYPNHPLQKLVEVIKLKEGTKTQYQLYRSNPTKLFCEQENYTAPVMNLNSLHYLGEGMDGGIPIRRWAAGMTPEGLKADKKVPPEAMKEMRLTDHSQMEFWDTNDGNRYPYYMGMIDSDKASFTSHSYYRDVKAGLKEKEVEAWLKRALHGSNAKSSCRRSRNLVKKTDGKWLTIPEIVGTVQEHKDNVNFYLDQDVASDPILYQPQSFRGYWALAKHGHKPSEKPKPQDEMHQRFGNLQTILATCEDYPEETYQMCRKDLIDQLLFASDNAAPYKNQTTTHSGGRRLNQRKMPTANYPNCPAKAGGWYTEKIHGLTRKQRWMTVKETKVECIKGCEDEKRSKSFGYSTEFAFVFPEVHGIALTVKGEYEEKKNIGDKGYWRATKITTRCYTYLDVEPPNYGIGGGFGGFAAGFSFGGFGGRRRELQTKSKPQQLWSHDKGVEYPREVWISANSPTQSTLKVTVEGSGEIKALKFPGVKQSFTAGGEASFVKPKGMPVQFQPASKIFVKYDLKQEHCYPGSMVVGVAGMSVGLEAALNISPTGIEALGSGNIKGYAQAKAKLPRRLFNPAAFLWELITDPCDCPGNDCTAIVGGELSGKIEIKLTPFECGKPITMTVSGEIAVKFEVAGGLSVSEKFGMDLYDGKVGDLRCI